MTWNLFLDDERDPPDDGRQWTVARSPGEFCRLIIEHGAPSYASFDHDLGVPGVTGMELVRVLVELDMDGIISIPDEFDFYVHSQNPVGAENIRFYLTQYLKLKEKY